MKKRLTGFEVVPLQEITAINPGDEYYFAVQPIPADAYDVNDYAICSYAWSGDISEDKIYAQSPEGGVPVIYVSVEFLSEPIAGTGDGVQWYSPNHPFKITVPEFVENAAGLLVGSISFEFRENLYSENYNMPSHATPYQSPIDKSKIWYPEKSLLSIINEEPIVLSRQNPNVQLEVVPLIKPQDNGGSYTWLVQDDSGSERVEITEEGMLSLIVQDDGFNKEPLQVECIYFPNGVPFSYQQINYNGRQYWVLDEDFCTWISKCITINFDNT